MTKKRERLIMAAVAGITMSFASSPVSRAEEKKDEVKCWGVNSCGHHAKCSVKEDDLKAFRTLLGDKEFETRFGKTETHSCGSHAKCGASSNILNWAPTTLAKCKADGGYLVEEVNKTKVAKKA